MTVKHQPRQSAEIYRDQILGCWLGKGIGGALGMPYEGNPHVLNCQLEDMSEEPLPNDDLELQLLWLRMLETEGTGIRAKHLAQAAYDYYICYPDEYGISKWNTARGLKPPVTGRHNNWFHDGMGAAIRSEIWACLFPGNPDLAAAFAREDAIIDHDRDGVWAEVFLAAVESALFHDPDLSSALEEGFKRIPSDCRVALGMRRVQNLHAEQTPWLETRAVVLKEFGHHNFTDVSMNLAFIMQGLLYGAGDFGQSIKMAINCGMDTDCTGATCGSILGIQLGAKRMSEEWKAVGRELAVSDCLAGLNLPLTADDLTSRTIAMADVMAEHYADGFINPTPDAGQPAHDHREWLIFPVRQEEGFAPPERIRAAQECPSEYPEQLVDAPGMQLELSEYIERPGDILYLLTWFHVDEDFDGHIMLCADTGMTVWLDDKQVMDYHGRRKALPAFHRTEGGGTVPISLEAGKQVKLLVRLVGCTSPLSFFTALGFDDWQYLHPVTYSLAKS